MKADASIRRGMDQLLSRLADGGPGYFAPSSRTALLLADPDLIGCAAPASGLMVLHPAE